MDIALLVIALFIPTFAALWTGIIFFIAVASGWRELAKRYTGTLAHSEKTFSSVTATMNRGDHPSPVASRYRSTLIIELSSESIGLKTWRLFKVGHSPLRIPWMDFVACRSEAFVFGTRYVLVVREPRVAIAIYGEAGKTALEYCRRLNPRADNPGV